MAQRKAKKPIYKETDQATWVDHLKAGFQPPEKREDYLREQVRKRAEEERKKNKKPRS